MIEYWTKPKNIENDISFPRRIKSDKIACLEFKAFIVFELKYSHSFGDYNLDGISNYTKKKTSLIIIHL